MGKRMTVMLIAVGVLFGGIFGWHMLGRYMMGQYFANMQEPPVTVSAIKASMSAWQPRVRAVGTLRAVQGVDVSSEVPGMVDKVHFKSGEKVEAGQLLVTLNADTDKAQLRSLQVAAELARTIYERDQKQFEIQAVSKAVLEADEAELKSRQAQVAQQESIIAKKTIKSPFAGQVGITSINVGQYINPGERIVTLQSLDRIFVDFFLPQQKLASLSRGQAIELIVDAYPDRFFKGSITALNPKVETGSRNVQVEALIDNPDHELLPGMFASVSVEIGQPVSQITLPQTAITFNPYGETVYKVVEKEKDKDGKPVLVANQFFVKSGDTRGDQIAVTNGVNEGDMIVTSGQLKLRNGSTVIINNEVQPTNNAAPEPVDQ